MPQTLEERIEIIERRNQRVELNKAWEVSKTRLVSVATLTYLCVSIVLTELEISRPWLNALIPTLGFLLSMQSLPLLKRRWIEHQLNRHRANDNNS